MKLISGWVGYIILIKIIQLRKRIAVKLKPAAIEAKFGYVKPLSFLQSWDKVLEQYKAIIKIDPQNTQANY